MYLLSQLTAISGGMMASFDLLGLRVVRYFQFCSGLVPGTRYPTSPPLPVVWWPGTVHWFSEFAATCGF